MGRAGCVAVRVFESCWRQSELLGAAYAASDRLGMSRWRRGGSVLRIGPGARPVLLLAVGNESRVPTLGLPEFSHLCGAAAAAAREVRDSPDRLCSITAPRRAPCRARSRRVQTKRRPQKSAAGAEKIALARLSDFCAHTPRI